MRIPLLALLSVVAFAGSPALAAPLGDGDLSRLKARADRVEIVRDDWGIAHVHGKTDADAVFGMVYAQAEDDFNRVETNYINVAWAELAEAEGEKADLAATCAMKLFIDPAGAQGPVRPRAPTWLQTLMTAWADGLNYYLATHPKRDAAGHQATSNPGWRSPSPRAASAAISRASRSDPARGLLRRTRRPGDDRPRAVRPGAVQASRRAPTASPSRRAIPSVGQRAIVDQPAHQRSSSAPSMQVTSDEGLNVYGAATWGQFFIYQGFNAKAGWMHTSSGVDVIDEFVETVVRRQADGYRYGYQYGKALRSTTKLTSSSSPTSAADGSMKSERRFTTYRTHHGPIVREADGKWVSVALMHRPVAALRTVIPAHQGHGLCERT
jgi:acyl-homoserine-lactone acylase